MTEGRQWAEASGDAGIERARGLDLRPVGLGIALAVASWLIAQPYFVLGQIRNAARKGDREALAQCVDFPALRENLKESLNAYVMDEAAAGPRDGPFAWLSAALAGATVDSVLDSVVTPSGIARMADARPPFRGSAERPGGAASDTKLHVIQSYVSASCFDIVIWPDDDRNATVTFVLRRRGMGWKLTDIRLTPFGAGRRFPESEVTTGSDSAPGALAASQGDAGDGPPRESGPTAVADKPPTVEDLPRFGEYVYVEELPRVVMRVSPLYPEAARDANVEGTVRLHVLVGGDGRVKDARIAKSIPMLDAAAITAVRQWIFAPAQAKNRPVAVWVALDVRFRLR